jgi:hypothetical protein
MRPGKVGDFPPSMSKTNWHDRIERAAKASEVNELIHQPPEFFATWD